ncbi:tripartite tricarboxylate transporter substrate binding protein [Streptomonospora sp. PA3]|uniref:Bug family tripartite tricarboxylate transporter substrate binding protein n=1 Tax=Streptomonospora sp. PA3 TaxID=2607326 RepID=UPI0012DF9C31|nr:tripartite tricarboxylate transporter substrate-binding protein [Streptomonospora sp. PA3]MUL44324.1 tripartite tricarboxylate transporter substrate binding protein [Streptomonospora sp. PA3]
MTDENTPGAAGGSAARRRRRGLARAGPFAAAAAVTVLLAGTAVAGGERETEHGFAEGAQFRILAPADPGGGWDQTAREMQAALRDQVGRAEVYNVGGAGGTIGLNQYARLPADPTELMVTGLIMVGAIETSGSEVTMDDTTPLARLTTDYEVIVVPEGSQVRDLADLVDLMREDLKAVSIAGGSAGGVEQILAGLIAQEIGADPAEVNYIAHAGGGELLSTVLSGRSTAAVSGVSEILPQIEAGRLRPIAVSSAERLPMLPDVPTLRESGVDVELSNWRGVVAPAGISREEERRLEDLIMTMARSRGWQEALDRRGWGDAALAGPEFEHFLQAERKRTTEVLDRIGLT